MDIRGRRSSFADKEVLVASPDPALPNERDAQPVVLIWDSHGFRVSLVTRVLSECEASPNWIESYSDIVNARVSTGCTIALVALGEHLSPESLNLEVVRILQQKGFRVISYADNVQSWPLGAQCQPLLAGSLRLLDSASAEFGRELQQLLVHLLQAETARRDEEEKIRVIMKELGVIGESQAMISLFRWALRVSVLSDLPTLVTGETGTGKQVLANAIYRLDPKRRNGPFVALNCGAISPGLAESELFGHRRGAFTGADRDRKGLIRSAQGGILFLDEIGELDEALQTKLLRMLQENRVLGVGEDQEISVDVRVIAATNRDLDKMVQQKKFRADLFHRLNVISIHIPPLRERPSDIKPLLEHFLQKYQFLKPRAALAVAADFLDAITQVGLPGNVRQLENVVLQALVNKEDDSPLNLSDLALEFWRRLSEQPESRSDESGYPSAQSGKKDFSARMPEEDPPSYLVKILDTNGWSLSRSLACCEKLFLEAALHQAQGNHSQTARLLGITPRSVYNKFRKYKI